MERAPIAQERWIGRILCLLICITCFAIPTNQPTSQQASKQARHELSRWTTRGQKRRKRVYEQQSKRQRLHNNNNNDYDYDNDNDDHERSHPFRFSALWKPGTSRAGNCFLTLPTSMSTETVCRTGWNMSIRMVVELYRETCFHDVVTSEN
ncbi:hypothetical protein M0804_007012 [Polistes exclamans]|nr:hypothetical protein M0804_007012 [Polistes exclamans]